MGGTAVEKAEKPTVVNIALRLLRSKDDSRACRRFIQGLYEFSASRTTTQIYPQKQFSSLC